MATPVGFDSMKSLLPEGGGVIHAMHGGGSFSGGFSSEFIPTDPMKSLLPMTNSIPIVKMEGGTNAPPGQDPVLFSSTPSVTPMPSGNAPLSSATPIATPSPSVNAPLSSATPIATPSPPVNAPLSSATPIATPSPSVNAPLSSATPIATPSPSVNAPLSSATPSVAPVEAPSVTNTTATVVTPPNSSNTKSNEPKTNNMKRNKKSNAPLIDGEKRVSVFGMDLVLQKPKEDTKLFTKDQEKVFESFGIQNASLSFKKEILKALYEGRCDTTKSLLMLDSCQPIRKLVQSLGLHLLTQMQQQYNENTVQAFNNQHNQVEGEEDKTKSISFSSQSQKDTVVEETEKQVASMDESIIGLRGIQNPNAISCYCNSAIQLLFSIPEIRSKLLSYPCEVKLTKELMEEEQTNTKGVLCALHDLFVQLNEKTQRFSSKEESFDKPEDALTPEKVQYIMKQFKLFKNLKGDLHDASELLSFIMDLFNETPELKSLFDSFSVLHKELLSCTASNGALVPIQGPHSDLPVTITRLSIPTLIQQIQNHSGSFSEEKKEWDKPAGDITFSISNLMTSYTFAEQKPGGDPSQCNGQPYSQQSVFEPTGNNRYFLFEIASADQMNGLDPSKKDRIRLKVEPRLILGEDGKTQTYVYVGAILYAPSKNGNTPHYTFERADSVKIHENPEQKTFEGIDRILYNDSTVKKQDDSVHSLSKEARVLIYRSEKAMDDWKKESEEKATALQSMKAIVPQAENETVKNEPPPELKSGDSYRAELEGKISDQAKQLKAEIIGYNEPSLFSEYDAKKEEVDRDLVICIQSIQDAKDALNAYLTTYKNAGSSPEQKEAYRLLESKIEVFQSNVEGLNKKLLTSSVIEHDSGARTVQKSLVHQLIAIRNKLEAKQIALTVHLTDVKQSLMEKEELSNVDQGKKWSSLYTVLHERLRDRQAVLQPFTDAIQSMDKWFVSIGEREKEMEDVKKKYNELIKKELEELNKQFDSRSTEEEKQANALYRNHLLNGFNKDAVDYYMEMKDGEEYKQADEEFKQQFSKLEEMQEELLSIVQSLPSSTGKQEAIAPMVEDEKKEVPDSEMAAMASSSESIPIIEPPSDVLSEDVTKEPMMENISPISQESSSSSTPQGPILPNEQDKNLAELPGGLVGGKQSENQKQFDEFIMKTIDSYHQMKPVFQAIVVTKKKVIEEFKEGVVIPELNRIQQRIEQEAQSNQQASLPPLTALQRNMIRLDLLNNLQTILTHFTELMNADLEKDIDLVNRLKTKIHQTDEGIRSFANELLNAYYHYVIKDINPPVIELLQDITADLNEFKAPFEADMKIMKQMMEENKIEEEMKTGNEYMTTLRGAVDAYNTALTANSTRSESSDLSQLAALRQTIYDTHTLIEGWLSNVESKVDEYVKINTKSSSPLIDTLFSLSDAMNKPLHTLIQSYTEFSTYRPSNNEYIFELVPSTHQQKVNEQIKQIKKRLEEWEDSTSPYSDTYRSYDKYINKAKKNVSDFNKMYSTYIRETIKIPSNEKVLDPETYEVKYRDQILQGKVMKMEDEDHVEDEKHEHPSIDPSLTEKELQLESYSEEFKNPDSDSISMEQIESFQHLADELLPLYDARLATLQKELEKFHLEQKKNEEEKAEIESESEAVYEQIQKDQKLNSSKKDLLTDPTFFSKLQIELKVRQEVTEHYQTRMEHQTKKLEDIESRIRGIVAEIEQLSSRKEGLIQEKDLLSKIHAEKKEAAEEQVKIQSAYHMELIEEAMKPLEENIQTLEKETASSISNKELPTLLEKKKQKLRTLQELIAAERAKVGEYQWKKNTNKAPSEPSGEIMEALKKDENTEENRSKLNAIKKGQASRKSLSDYLQRLYPDIEWKEDDLRRLHQAVKNKSNMKDLLKGLDPDHILLKTGIELGIFSPENNTDQTYINEFLEKHKQDETPMQFFEDLESEFNKISIYLPDPRSASTNYIVNYKDDFMKLYNKVLQYAPDKNQSFENTLQVELQNGLKSLRKKLNDERTSIFERMAERVESKEKEEAEEKLNDQTISLEEYKEYRKRIELLYAMMDESFEPELISRFKQIYDMKIQEIKDREQREEEERKQEEEKKRQEEEKAIKNEEERKHQENRATYVKQLVGLQTAISLFESIPADTKLTPEWKNLETELIHLYDQFEIYRNNLKNLPKTNEVKTNYMEFFTPKLNGIREIQTKIGKMNAALFNTPEYREIMDTVTSLTSNIPQFLSTSYDSLLRENERVENHNRYNAFSRNRNTRKKEKERIAAEEAKKKKERENRIQVLRTKKQTEHQKELNELSKRMKKVEDDIRSKKRELNTLDARTIQPAGLGVLLEKLGKRGVVFSKNNNSLFKGYTKGTKTFNTKAKTKMIDRVKDYMNPAIVQLEQEKQELEAKKESLLQVNLNEVPVEDEKSESVVKKTINNSNKKQGNASTVEEKKSINNPFIPSMMKNNSVKKNREVGITSLNQRQNLKQQLQTLNTKYKKLGDLSVQMETLLRDKEHSSQLIQLLPMLTSIGYLTPYEENQFKSYSQDRLFTEMQFKKKRVNNNMEMIPMEKDNLVRKLNHAMKAVNSASYNEYVKQVPSENQLTKKEFNKLKIQQLDNDFETLRILMTQPYSDEHYNDVLSILKKHQIKEDDFVESYNKLSANQKKNNKQWDQFLDQARSQLADKKSDLMSNQQGGYPIKHLKKTRKNKRKQ